MRRSEEGVAPPPPHSNIRHMEGFWHVLKTFHLAYIYAKWRPGGDIFLVFTERILEWGGGAPSRAENSQREGGPAWAGLSSVRPSVRSSVRHTPKGPKRASKSLKFR